MWKPPDKVVFYILLSFMKKRSIPWSNLSVNRSVIFFFFLIPVDRFYVLRMITDFYFIAISFVHDWFFFLWLILDFEKNDLNSDSHLSFSSLSYPLSMIAFLASDVKTDIQLVWIVYMEIIVRWGWRFHFFLFRCVFKILTLLIRQAIHTHVGVMDAGDRSRNEMN